MGALDSMYDGEPGFGHAPPTPAVGRAEAGRPKEAPVQRNVTRVLLTGHAKVRSAMDLGPVVGAWRCHALAARPPRRRQGTGHGGAMPLRLLFAFDRAYQA
jgi:hypothetical protein